MGETVTGEPAMPHVPVAAQEKRDARWYPSGSGGVSTWTDGTVLDYPPPPMDSPEGYKVLGC